VVQPGVDSTVGAVDPADPRAEVRHRDWEAVRARDRELVTRCLGGDEVAWATLWERYGPLVKAVARRTGCDDEEVRDVVQRVGLVAVQSLERLREKGKVAGWLAGVARRQALATLRQRRPFEPLDPDRAGVDVDADAALLRDERLAVLRRAFVRLDARCQRLVRRLDLTEPNHSYAEVAADEGLAASSIGPIRRRCLKRLRQLIDTVSRSGRAGNCTGGG
jgi:RNA polymerase sigma factor (sigma-70 family)